MKSFPLPVRVAAGLAVAALEQARTLPTKLVGLPVTVASQALQVSMRVQQQVTELAIRGDEVLSGLRPVEETPEWATFDEDIPDTAADGVPGGIPLTGVFDDTDEDTDSRYGASRPSAFDRVSDEDVAADLADVVDITGELSADTTDDPARANGVPAPDPWEAEETALAGESELDEETELAGETELGVGTANRERARKQDFAAAENYDQLSLAQVRARMRRYSVAELTELLDHERAHANRPSFVGMLTRRIATVRDQQ